MACIPPISEVGIILVYYLAVWSFSAIRFTTFLIDSAVWLNIRPSGFLFIQPYGFGLMDKSALKVRGQKFYLVNTQSLDYTFLCYFYIRSKD